MTTRFKVRPFERYVEREEGRPALTFKGTFDGSVLLIEIEGAKVEVPLADPAEDNLGVFGFVESTTFELERGLKLILEGNETEGHLSLKDTENDRGFGIFFHASGVLDGSNTKLLPSKPRSVN